MKRGRIVLCFTLLTGALQANASVGQSGAAFLEIPVGAGPAALGSAYSAVATDAYAPTWNPAGLGRLESTQVAGQHLSYLESVNYEYASVVHPIRPGRALGASVQYLGSGDMEGMSRNEIPTGDFSLHYAAYSLAYGHALTEKLAAGVTGKWINAKISDVSANAYATDLGLHYKLNARTHLAAVAANIGSRLTFLNDSDPLPMAFRVSAAHSPTASWTLLAEGVIPKDGSAGGHFGVQWQPLSLLSLRAGYRTDLSKNNTALAGFSTGIGVQVWGSELGYAWVPYGDLGNTQYFSLLLRFGEKTREQRNLIHFQSIKTHRVVEGSGTKDADPEYQQMLQILDDSSQKVAQTSEGQKQP